jgi:hypothetical protein
MHAWQQHVESPKDKFQPPRLADAGALNHASGGRRMATAEGRLYPHGTATCMQFGLQW